MGQGNSPAEIVDLDGFLSGAVSGSDKAGCKFVLLTHGESAVVVVGSLRRFAYHANLLDGWCRKAAIASSWVRKPDLLEILDHEVSVRGGGWIGVDPENRLMAFGGYSTAYGRFDEVLLESVADSLGLPDGWLHRFEE